MLNYDDTINFLEKIEKAYPTKRKIHIFFANARYYKNKLVENFLKNSKIKAHFLPPYSPNLNPIEQLWKWMKERVLYNTYYQEFGDFKNAIFGLLENISRLDRQSALGQSFASLVKDNFRAIGAVIPNS